MKILLLADPASSHTVKWANSLNNAGFEIKIFGLSDYNPDAYNKNIAIITRSFSEKIKNKKDGNFQKSVYLFSLSDLKKVIKDFKPDILHAHSASSYGLLGALTGFHPYFVSVWGSDVYIFPKKSLLHKSIYKFVMKKGDKIFSTSHAMKKETSLYTKKEISVIPFGIDTNVFKAEDVKSIFDKNDIIIGTVKKMEDHYGIKYLIDAFRLTADSNPKLQLKLLLVGGGRDFERYQNYIQAQGLNEKVVMTGLVPYSEVVKYQNMIDISVIPSLSESFGVSVLEASACEKPVIVSDTGGLPEVVKDGITGFIVPPKDVNAISEKLNELIHNRELRIKLGKNGRKFVEENYRWEYCVQLMKNEYLSLATE